MQEKLRQKVYNRSHDRSDLGHYMKAMNILSQKAWPIVALLISSGLLIGAWIFQYGFGYPPCQMCYWQRHAHKVVIGLAGLALVDQITGGRFRKPLLVLIALAFLVSFGLAFWHVGVEYKWWEGPKTCMGGSGDLDVIDPGSLLESLNDPVKLPACSDALWHFLGLSMAGWNALISFVAAALSFKVFWSKSDV